MINMTDKSQELQAEEVTQPAYALRYFVSLDANSYINGMFIAFTQEDADNYVMDALSELNQMDFESVGPDCQLISGEVVKGVPIVPILSMESKNAILSAHLREATEMIQTLQDAVDLGMATTEEVNSLVEWKKYRVFLSRTDVKTTEISEWPAKPEA